MSPDAPSTADDVEVSDRLQPIHVSTRYLGGYKSEVRIRDLSPMFLDEPRDLGGDNDGPTPLESVLASLCGCTAMIAHILEREMRFELSGMRCEADGVVDVRRAEMKRSGKKYSEVEPIAHHFHAVHQRIYVTTPESDERLEILKGQVARLCPVSRLLEDAGVRFEVRWIRE
jgi:uncharacterized OsmC-like protein